MRDAREERKRQVVHGRYALRGQLPARFWLWSTVVLSAFGVIYWKVWQGELASLKSAVMAKQRAVAQTLEPQVVPLRDRIEGWVQELGGPAQPDRITDAVTLDLLNSEPGVYLRLRLESAQSVDQIRDAASVSLLDGFTSCMFVRHGAGNPAEGPPCRTSADCGAGLLCNEYKVCLPPPKPYNMRLAYQALRVLSSDWTDELHEASTDLAVNAFERDLERVVADDVPIAVSLLAKATFFTLVLDEDPKAGLPEALDDDETPEQQVQRAQHPARVGIWNLKTGKQLVRLRTVAGGRLVPAGERVITDPVIQAAQQRQANNCSLALAVKTALGRAAAPPEPEAPAPPASAEPAPSAAPAPSASQAP